MKYQPNDAVIVTIGSRPPERAIVVAFDSEAGAYLCQMEGEPGVQGLVEESELSAVTV
jgi:hypothetical protein